MKLAILTSCLIGAATFSATLWKTGGSRSAPAIPIEATEEYGRRLIANSSELLGPDAGDPKMRYTASRLACASCHLGAGTEPGTLTLLQTTQHYPRFSARVGAKIASVDEVWAGAELLLKVKEPIEPEYKRLRSDLTLFTYLHIAADEPLTRALVDSGISAVAYETVETGRGQLPLLAPMSEIGRAHV